MSEKNEQSNNNLSIGVGGLYPIEIKGYVETIRKDDRHIIVRVEKGQTKNGHKTERLIRVDQSFNLEAFNETLTNLKQFSINYIGDKVKELFGVNCTELRHLLATDQLIKYQDIKGVSDALGHNSIKNVAYYIDYEMCRNLLGLTKTEELIRKTEHNHIYSLMKVAIRSVLEDYFRDIT